MADDMTLARKDDLVKLQPLCDLLADDLDDLAKNTVVETLPAGSTLFTQGASDPLTIYLLAGEV